MSVNELTKELHSLADPARATILGRFFKTGPGQYGEGDLFLGIMVPTAHKLVSKYYLKPDLADIDKLIGSPYHEVRLVALLMLVKKYEKTKSDTEKSKIYEYYLKNREHINNWDLVDLSTPKIVGDYLLSHPREFLYQLAGSDDLWERRISIMATFAFIRAGEFEDTLKLSRMLLHDPHDLIHKAVGWMLREMGKKDKMALLNFLDEYASVMPRTMLRYAIEKLSDKERKYYLKKER